MQLVPSRYLPCDIGSDTLTRSQQRLLARSIAMTIFVVLCVNVVTFEVTRNPLCLIGIVLSIVAMAISAVAVYFTWRNQLG